MHVVVIVDGGQCFLPDCCKNNQKAAEAFAQDIMDRYGNTEYFDEKAIEYHKVNSWWWRLLHWLRAFPK